MSIVWDEEFSLLVKKYEIQRTESVPLTVTPYEQSVPPYKFSRTISTYPCTTSELSIEKRVEYFENSHPQLL